MTDDIGFQATSSLQGRSFEDAVEQILKASGWQIIAVRTKVAGVEIDIIARSNTGRSWWIECKGSHRGATPGSQRGDTVKKAVGVAAYLSRQPERVENRYMLVTSHLPKPGTVPDRLLDEALAAGWFDRVWSLPVLDDVDEVDE